MNAKLSIAVLSLGFFATLSPSAAAGEFGFSIGQQSKHGSLSFSYSTGGPACGYATSNYGPVHTTCNPHAVWVRGHYEYIPAQVWVPGEPRTVWVDARFATRYDSCGRPVTVCVSPGYWKTIFVAGHYETQSYKAFKPGAWVTVAN